jgi:integrase
MDVSQLRLARSAPAAADKAGAESHARDSRAARNAKRAKLVKTSTPGIYRRHVKQCNRVGRCECPYVVIHDGKMRTFPNMTEAREGKRIMQRQAKLSQAHQAGLHREEPRDQCPLCDEERTLRDETSPFFHTYALDWVERYQGTGRRGYREETRDEDRRLLKAHALKFFPHDLRVNRIRPRQVDDFIGWLVKQPSRRGGTLSDNSVRNALQPVSSCLATARREDLIEHNPCDDAVLPHRPAVEEDEDKAARPFPRIEVENADGETDVVETMELVVSLVRAERRLMFELLAATGVRRSELIAFQVRDLVLTGSKPFVKIRRRIRRRRGHGLVVGALKSRYGRRELPITCKLADRLATHVAGRGPKDWVFATADGKPLDPDNLATRVLAPACEKAGVAWAGFHTFRHTVASRLFAEGRNIVQVQHWLGHHSPSFTLDTYVHLLDGNLEAPLQARATASTSASSLDPDPQLAAA